MSDHEDAERIALAAEGAMTAMNEAIQRLVQQRDDAHALLTEIRAYLETRPTRTPMVERIISRIIAQTKDCADAPETPQDGPGGTEHHPPV